jgi:hypothetical protein
MYSRKKNTYIGPVLTTLLVVIAFVADIIFSTSRIPVFTSTLCGIVVLYELVSPFIYAAR